MGRVIPQRPSYTAGRAAYIELGRKMKCPYCSTRVPWPHLRGGNSAGLFNQAWGNCPNCGEKITYAFSGKRAVALILPAGVLCWLISNQIGESALLIFPLIVLIPSMRLEKWYSGK